MALKTLREFYFQGDRRHVALLAISSLMVAMFWSPTMMSCAMILLLANSIFNPNIANNLKDVWRNKSFLALTLIFFIYAISSINSGNTTYLVERLRIKLPFLLMPFAFASFSPLTKRQYMGLLAFFLVITSFVSLGVLANYLIHFDTINDSISYGKAIPTPINHIRFSLTCAIACLSGIHLFVTKTTFFKPFERWLYATLALFLALFIHILAVRSGILGLYCGAIGMLMVYIIRSKKWLLGSAFLAIILLAPFIAYKTIPSLRDKIGHTEYDLRLFFQTGEVHEGYSNAERILTLQLGMDIGKENLWTGIGVGDLKDEMDKRYAEHCADCETKIPHNQFIFVFAATGIIGLIIFVFSIFLPLFYHRHYADPLFLGIFLVLISSFLWESTIEEQLGTAIFILFLLLPLNYFSAKEKAQNA